MIDLGDDAAHLSSSRTTAMFRAEDFREHLEAGVGRDHFHLLVGHERSDRLVGRAP
jgi:hypothetical protein